MNRQSQVYPAVAALLLFSLGVSSGSDVTPIAVPGSLTTEPDDISGGRIVGVFQDSTFRSSGFLYEGGNYATIDYPGSFESRATGIDQNLIVGTYRGSPGDFRYRGFLFDGTNYTSIDYPSAGHTFAEGVDAGNVVGWYLTGDGPGSETRGFHYNGSIFSTISYPGSMATNAYGIDANRIVGSYLPGGGPGGGVHGFLFDGTTYTPLDFPGSNGTEAYGISGHNIVGRYIDSSFVSRGFIYNGTDWTTIDIPFANGTRINGVDDDNLVGSYQVGPVQHGFQTTKPVPPTEYDFRLTGEIISVEDHFGWFNNSFQVGDVVEGNYNLFDSGYEFSSGGVEFPVASYTFPSGPHPSGLAQLPARLQLTIDGRDYVTSPTTVAIDYQLQLINDSHGYGITAPPAGDSYILTSPLSFPTNFIDFACDSRIDPNCLMMPYTQMSFRLYDPLGTTLSSLDLPLDAPNVSQFASAIGRIRVVDANTLDNYAVVEFRVNSIIAVPEPNGLIYFMIAIVGAFHAVRRASSSDDHNAGVDS